MDICVLGSGSSGNCTIVRVGGCVMLIDAGLGPRTVARRMDGTGIQLDDVRCIVLTHLDGDHFRPSWHDTILKRHIDVYCPVGMTQSMNESLRRYRLGLTLAGLRRQGRVHTFSQRPFRLPLSSHFSVQIQPVRLPHDAKGTYGLVVDDGSYRLGHATDLGHVPEPLVKAMMNVDVLAIESNYDLAMEQSSSRPPALKRRIMGGRGHLSNEQAFEAIGRIVTGSQRPPHHIVLLHLSRQCNDPKIVQRLYDKHPTLARRLCITNQYQRTGWLTVNARRRPLKGEQLTMFA